MKTVKSVIYVLKLRSDKYYVGRSTTYEQRIQQHVTGEGSEWTRKYPPTSDEPIELLEDEGFMELSTTLKYMKSYGIDNVRGADYSSLKLSMHQKDEIEKHFRSEDNLCFRCGGNHFIRECDQNESESGWLTGFLKWFAKCRSKQSSKRITFGKYAGKTYEEILKKHPEYCYWILNNTSPPYSPNFEEFRDWCSTECSEQM